MLALLQPTFTIMVLPVEMIEKICLEAASSLSQVPARVEEPSSDLLPISGNTPVNLTQYSRAVAQKSSIGNNAFVFNRMRLFLSIFLHRCTRSF